MNLSTRSEYGLRALLDLAKTATETPIPLRDLAQRNHLPHKFLEQIFLSLRTAGVVHSQVGTGGGYTLGRPAEKITLGEVIRILDGRLAPVRCLSHIDYQACSCPDESGCLLRLAMSPVRQAIVDVVDHTTLADVVKAKSGRSGR